MMNENSKLSIEGKVNFRFSFMGKLVTTRTHEVNFEGSDGKDRCKTVTDVTVKETERPIEIEGTLEGQEIILGLNEFAKTITDGVADVVEAGKPRKGCKRPIDEVDEF